MKVTVMGGVLIIAAVIAAFYLLNLALKPGESGNPGLA